MPEICQCCGCGAGAAVTKHNGPLLAMFIASLVAFMISFLKAPPAGLEPAIFGLEVRRLVH
jgi:hypothetical protein